MARSYDYCVLRFRPDALRGEVVNVGLVIFANRVDVRLTTQLAKAQALAPNLSLDGISEIADDIADLCEGMSTDDALMLLSGFAPFTCSSKGFFLAEPDEYEIKVEQTMRWLVHPPRRPSVQEGRSRLFTEVRKEFDRFKMLGKDSDDLTKHHKVLASYPMPGEEDLQADFLLKNTYWHITQVIDYQTTPKSAHGKIKEIGLKAITIDQAPRLLGSEAKGYVLVRVPEEFEAIARPHLDLMSQYCTDIYRYDKEADRKSYWKRMAAAAKLPAGSLLH